jgi:UDP-galactopyranose mutase
MTTNFVGDLICFSHLRWAFVFQRPQHLMSRFAKHRRVYFFEEPVFEEGARELRSVVCPQTGVVVVTPVFPPGTTNQNVDAAQERMLRDLLKRERIENFIAWYYTPMAVEFTRAFQPSLTIYDCMDELSAFRGAPPAMRTNEQALFRQAELVFTGGASLFESKQLKHPSVHLFPSSVDVPHFAQARSIRKEPSDLQAIPHPRLGYAGVIDERMNLELIAGVAESRPDWQIVMIGPVVKIDPGQLPRASNIHYLGMKQYSELPAYLAGWDVAMLPFAQNESTRFISPTKTPEYLAAGLPVVSTPIRDVVRPYAELGLVEIAQSTGDYVSAVEGLLRNENSSEWRADVHRFLATLSWDRTWKAMDQLIESKLAATSSPLELAAAISA